MSFHFTQKCVVCLRLLYTERNSVSLFNIELYSNIIVSVWSFNRSKKKKPFNGLTERLLRDDNHLVVRYTRSSVGLRVSRGSY